MINEAVTGLSPVCHRFVSYSFVGAFPPFRTSGRNNLPFASTRNVKKTSAIRSTEFFFFNYTRSELQAPYKEHVSFIWSTPTSMLAREHLIDAWVPWNETTGYVTCWTKMLGCHRLGQIDVSRGNASTCPSWRLKMWNGTLASGSGGRHKRLSAEN